MKFPGGQCYCKVTISHESLKHYRTSVAKVGTPALRIAICRANVSARA
jgi:hypothetical protein